MSESTNVDSEYAVCIFLINATWDAVDKVVDNPAYRIVHRGVQSTVWEAVGGTVYLMWKYEPACFGLQDYLSEVKRAAE